MAKERDFDEPTMAEVLATMAQIQKDNLQLQRDQMELQRVSAEKSADIQREQLKQTAAKSLKRGPNISVFNPRGEKDFPMPTLKCEVYAPWKMSPMLHSLDREEVELFNLLEPGEYVGELNDGTTVPVNVVGVRNSENGKLEKLSLQGAKDEGGVYMTLFTKERRNAFPALRLFLRQLIGDPASAVMPMKEEERRVKQFLDAPEDGKAAAVQAGALPVSVGA